jgi:glycosyltransferase involved in cell wall biosynthesis
MRIVLDLQGAQSESRFRGIGRYSLALAKAIVANRGDHEVLVALNGLLAATIEPIRAAFDTVLPQENIRVWLAPGPVREIDATNSARREIAEHIREAFLAALNPDIVHVSSVFEGFGYDTVTSIGVFAPQIPTAVTLYDLIPLRFPSSSALFRQHYARKLDSFRRANLWLGISKFSCDQAVELLHLDPGQVINIGGAADTRFRRMELSQAERDRIRQAFGLQKPFICWVGTPADPRKNLTGLMRAFAQLAPELRNKFQILVIGRVQRVEVDALNNAVALSGLLPSEVVFAGYVSDDELARLYNMCHAFVFPSVFEGFGLPVLEAMQCGAPAIASNTTSIPEVVDFEAATFDPHSIDDIQAKLRRVLTDENFRAALRSRQQETVRRFSWDESARKTIKAFEDCHAPQGAKLIRPQIYQSLITSVAKVFGAGWHGSDFMSAARAIAQNFAVPKMEKTLFVDISELRRQDTNTGIQRVTRSLLRQLVDAPPAGYKVEPVYGTRDRPGYRYAKRFTEEFLNLEDDYLEDTLIDVQQGDVFFGLDLQQEVVWTNQDYLAQLRNLGVKVYFLIHDLLPIRFPHYFRAGLSEAHNKWLSVLSQSDGVICVSRSVADEYIEWLSANKVSRQRPLRIGWSHSGADLTVSAPATGLLAPSHQVLAALSSGPSFLMVGTIEPRKGQAQVLAAFECLWAAGHDLRLVVVGNRGWKVDQLVDKLDHHPERGTRLFLLDRVSDEYLGKLYAACSCLIAASEGEGFGLPLIEAAQHKTPILARDIAVFREIAGNHAGYFHGTDPQEFARTVTEWLALRADGRHPKSDDMPWLTWRQSAERLKAILLGEDWYKVWPPTLPDASDSADRRSEAISPRKLASQIS